MKTEFKKLHLTLLCCLTCALTFGQVQLPKTPTPSNFQTITPNQYLPENVIPMASIPSVTDFGQNRVQQQNQRLIQEVEQNEKLRAEQLNQVHKDIAEFNSNRINYSLPSKNHIAETQFYQNTFDKLNGLNPDGFSVKDATFIIENAFYEEQKDFSEFENIIKQTGDFLRQKMDELGYDPNSNLAKNFILFQFFSDTLEIKDKKLKHLPFEYDFEDYMGRDDWTKMFVHKLLETGKGQCNSLPRLYLILAEEINAEAFLSLSPNHSYIRFRDEEENWYNVELTNGMFTVDSFILQSGYIKSEALQSGIYMENLTSKQLLAQLLTDLATGYTRKFGFDPFVKQVTDKALELAPDMINTNMFHSDFLTVQFEHAAQQVDINPRDKADLQNIRYYPPIVSMLNEVNSQYRKIDDLGYEYMPAQAYEAWLNSLMEAKQQQNNETMKQQFNIKLNQLKN